MAKNKKQKANDDLENVFEPVGSDKMEIMCKHCGSSYILEKGFDENYCSQECMEADQEE